MASPQPDLPLSIEPVVGWRVWRLERRDGQLRLIAIAGQEPWPPGTPMRAKCRRMSHAAPQITCSCGLYATSSAEALARASVYSSITSVVGAVAMWGTVVEHAHGVRAAVAYPARLALVCGPCLDGGRRGEPEVVASIGTILVGLCKRHRLRHPASICVPAGELQAELLGTYGVELLPPSRIVAAARHPVEPRDLITRGVSGIIHVLGFFLALWLGLSLLGIFFIAVGEVGAAVFGDHDEGVTTPTPTAPTPVPTFAAVSPLRGIGPAFRAPSEPVRVSDSTFVCGVGEGRTVALVRCGDPASDLIGFSRREPPNGPAEDCVGVVTAYSRGAHFWVCWAGFLDGIDVRPWAHTINPFTTPDAQGGSAG